MPRGKKRTTQSGEDAQNIESVPGQRYGEGVEQQAMQRAMPAPDMSASTPNAPTAAAPGPPPEPVDPAQLLGSAPIGLLSGGTQLPGQPLTAGLSSGPGVGPEALGGLRPRTPLSRTIHALLDATGDPVFQRLIDRGRL